MTRTACVEWGSSVLEFSYHYAVRKTLAISVNPDLSVTVVAPLGTPLQDIKARVAKRAGWIDDSRREFTLHLPQQPARAFVSGETHRYLGRQYRLRIRQGEHETTACKDGYINITCRGESSPSQIKTRLEDWYLGEALRIFPQRFALCRNLFGLSSLPQATMEIRRLKTRWGSCSPRGRITLNQALIKAPVECIDYVIVHELCHLKEHNHGDGFWRLLSSLIPDYHERKRRLNLIEHV